MSHCEGDELVHALARRGERGSAVVLTSGNIGRNCIFEFECLRSGAVNTDPPFVVGLNTHTKKRGNLTAKRRVKRDEIGPETSVTICSRDPPRSGGKNSRL